jgi:hypothetical protein
MQFEIEHPFLSQTPQSNARQLDAFWSAKKLQFGLKLTCSQHSSTVALEAAMIAHASVYLAMTFVPYQLKKGMSWYRNMIIILIAVAFVILISLFRHSEKKVLKFLAVQTVVLQVVALAILDWLRYIVWPAEGWEAVDPMTATITFAVWKILNV